ncbi:MAG: hypothetical protein ACYS7Y_29285 [Planctomycetota bacterium]
MVFRACAVSINAEFEKKCPSPVPPMIQKKGQNVPDVRDKDYLQAVTQRSAQKFALMAIRSIEESAIEWDEVDLEKPNTWLKWEDELKEAGLSDTEFNRVVGLVMAANSLDESKVEAAREAFLRGQGK